MVTKTAAQHILLDIGGGEWLADVQIGHQESAEDEKEHDVGLSRAPAKQSVSLQRFIAEVADDHDESGKSA
jgi:hypothetical protein